MHPILSAAQSAATARAAAFFLRVIDLAWARAADIADEAGCPPPPRFLDARVAGVDDTAVTDLRAVRS